MELKNCFKIGYILKPHGLKGEVTVSLDEEAPDNIESLDTVFLLQNNNLVPYFISAISVRDVKAFVKFDDIDSPEAAQDISKTPIYLPKEARPKSGKGEFYDDEITGFLVTDQQLGDLGVIQEVMSAGPNRLLVLDHQGKEVLIPVNSPFILSINKSKKKIAVSLPDGFLDI